jgi:putative addiction module component (TIGR02574 family)
MKPPPDPMLPTKRPQELPITDAQRAALQDRLAETRAHPETSIPWEVARERMRRAR